MKDLKKNYQSKLEPLMNLVGQKNFTKKSRWLFIVTCALSLLSCEKEIAIELPEAAKKMVVEGSIEPGLPPFVMLTKTAGYFDPVDINALQNAFVHDAVIFVNNGTSNIQLTEICTNELPDSLLPAISELLGVSYLTVKNFGFCLYTTLNPLMFGEVGKNYFLEIQAEGEILTATTTIPNPIIMEDYWYKDQPGYTDYGYLWFQLNDPQPLGSSYRIYTQRLGKDDRFIPTNGSVFDDTFFNGLNFKAFILRGSEVEELPVKGGSRWSYFQQGDSIAIKFCTIDQAHFQFWNSFENAAFSNGNPFAAPSTIKTNIEGGLGVWGGYGVSYDTIVALD